MNVPLMAESDDTKVDDSLVPDNADTKMNDSVPNSSIETADRRITRSWKKKHDQLLEARRVSILPESEVQNEELGNTEVVESAESRSHRGMRSGAYVANSLCQSWRVGGSLSKLGIMCKETCKSLLIGYSLLATLVIIILSI